jgi:NitT/TauT family transport system ATP-binding protein
MANIIELKDICQSYGSKEVIKGLNVAIEDKPKGEIVAILGPSGCGKSTLLRYVSGLQAPTAGEVILHGEPRSEEDRVGMVFQKYSSLPWRTVLENVELGLELSGVDSKTRRERALAMLELVELSDHANKFAQYPTLSGGQLQRVAIARSLVANSKILLMDEPFGALDIKTRLKMQDTVLNIGKKLSQEITVLFVTHDISEAVYLADEIIIMGGSPSKIVDKISIPFGDNRSHNLKDNAWFKSTVRDIEERMMRD